jgi:ABC-type polysaccharide/polyol phosphate transport system ATPase subunit
MGVAIRAEGLGKQYTLGRSMGQQTLKETLAGATGRIGSFVRGRRPESSRERIWAMRDVSFEIPAGQVVGIIGANGAGKSTLLKLLSRVTEPTEGRATIAGRVGSLLEVGTGFHPELTGRENIFLNGAILGMRRADIRQRFDEIVAFAEVARFLDTAVKHYSDGMYLRLAFAVAAHLEPDVLLVDEVLAVGDARFQRKCLGKMTEIAEQQGRTVLVVSHSMGTIQRLCDQSLLLEAGRLAAMGPTPEIVARYLRDVTTAGADQWIDVSAAARRGTGEARFRRVRYSSGVERAGLQPYPDGPLQLTFEIEAAERRDVPSFGVVFADRSGIKLVNADILAEGLTLHLESGTNRVRLSIEELHLNAGAYQVTLWIGDTTGPGYDLVEPAFELDVVPLETAGFGMRTGSEHGSVTCRVTLDQP